MSTPNTVVAFVLASLGLPVRFCGVNADWIDRAWHLGPSDQPNRVSGDYYILVDDAEDGNLFTLVRREIDETHEQGGEIAEIFQGGLIEVAQRASEVLKQARAVRGPEVSIHDLHVVERKINLPCVCPKCLTPTSTAAVKELVSVVTGVDMANYIEFSQRPSKDTLEIYTDWRCATCQHVFAKGSIS